MTAHPVLIHVPVGTGATGREPLRKFYREVFIPQVPPDTSLELLTRSVTSDRLVDEFVLNFTHTLQIDWLVPRETRSARSTSTGTKPRSWHSSECLTAICPFWVVTNRPGC